MSGDRQPRPGDRVRFTVEGVVTDLDDHECVAMVKADGEERAHYVPRGADVEVLEPADDPSADPWGAVRRGPNGAIAIHMHVRRIIDGYAQGWRLTKGSVELTDEQVVGWEVIGAVPGTPAAEQQPSLAVHLTKPLSPEVQEALIASLERARLEARPPLSEYSRHLEHATVGGRADGCSFCSPEGTEP